MRVLLLFLAALLLPSVPMPADAADEVFSVGGVAIRGYDPVAYHTHAMPLPGSPAIVHEWNGATWHFATSDNRDLFAADPERYAPQYGGYCAYGTSRGYKVSTQPEAFAIVDGKLYLNYSAPVQATWNKDRRGHIDTADRNWQSLRSTVYEPEKSAADQ